jgi:hypothetical protein
MLNLESWDIFLGSLGKKTIFAYSIIKLVINKIINFNTV